METKKTTAPEGVEKSNAKEFALGKKNYLLIAVSFILIVVGFVLMMGSGSTDEAYNPDIFSTRRIVIAPTITFIGFVCMIFAILRKPKQ
jgi:cell division protein FtsW (lipid II flippase)